VDRHGKPRYYLRRRGFKKIPLPGLPWSPEFMSVYEGALKGAATIEIGASKTVAGTAADIVVAYLDCSPRSTSPFQTLARETQITRRNILDNYREQHGCHRIYYIDGCGRRIMLLTREHMQRIINEKVATPFAQRNLLNTLRAMFQWALSEGRVPGDPTI